MTIFMLLNMQLIQILRMLISCDCVDIDDSIGDKAQCIHSFFVLSFFSDPITMLTLVGYKGFHLIFVYTFNLFFFFFGEMSIQFWT
jgi:hypothetical protein